MGEKFGQIKAKLVSVTKNEKVQKAVLAGAAYYAGAHGGPYAAGAVEKYGPSVLKGIIWLLAGG